VAVVAVKQKRRRRTVREMGRDIRRNWSAYLFISPGIVFLFIFSIYTMSVALWLSFHRWDIIEPAHPYVGWANYNQALHDPDFWHAVLNTFIMSLGIPVLMGLGLAIALLLNTQIRALGLFRTLYYIPVITPLVVAAIVWKWVYGVDYGLANYYLLKLHLISTPLLWLSSIRLALPAVVIMGIWKGAGFAMIVYLAGLQAIPQELYEAAEVDGAGAFTKFWRITLPLLRPSSFFLLVILLIGSLQVFDQIYIMTNGGPLQSTTTIVYFIYRAAFVYFQMGYASALAYILFAMLLVLTIIQFRLYTRGED
jgi:multiple sugar transport system permease protein